MKLCRCKAPLWAAVASDGLKCGRCGAWTPFGNPTTAERFTRRLDEVDSLLGRIRDDYVMILGIGYGLSVSGGVGRRSSPSDPTLSAVTDGRRERVRRLTVLAARILERALADIKRVDEALGDALLAVDHGPADRAGGQWYEGDPTLLHADAVEAQGRRQARGEVAL